MNLAHPVQSVGALVRTTFFALILAVCAWSAMHPSTVSAAMAPANSVIGNQASATYVDNTATTRTSTSNTVQTTVAAVKSSTLTMNGARNAPPNAQVCYPHTITNTGNGADTYALNPATTGGMFAHTGLAYFLDSNQDGVPDNGTAITSTGPLNANTSFGFVVCGTTPGTATLGQQGTIAVSVTDTNAPATTLSNTDTTTIQVASITVNKKLSSVPPPGYTPVNTGASPNPGPLFVVLDYINNGTTQADGLVLQDVLPAGMLYVPGSGRWSGSGATALTDAAGGDPAGITYQAPAAAISGTVLATVTSVAGSTSGNLYFQVTIAANLAPTPASQAPTTNTADYRYNYQFGGQTFCVNGASTTIIAAPNAGASCPTTNGQTNTLVYIVQQAASVAANGSQTTYGIADSDPLTVASTSPGQTITWTDVIWNTGNGTDSFDITSPNTPLNGSACNPAANLGVTPTACTFPLGTTFSILSANGMTSLLDSNGNGTPDTGNIPQPTAGVCPAPYIASTQVPVKCGYPIVISASLPANAPAGNNGGPGYQIVLRAISFFNNTVSDTVTDKLGNIVANTVDITNNLSVAGGAAASPSNNTGNGLGASGAIIVTTNSVTPATATPTTTRFILYVNNTGATPAIYNLASSFVSVPAGILAVPAGWTVAFKDDGGAANCSTTTGGALTSTGATPVPAGGSKLICAEVVVPSTNTASGSTSATAAAVGNYVLSFTSTNQADTSVTDSIRDQVTVQPLHSVTLTPIGAQSTVPGGSVTYTHSLTNNGNATEAITFPAGFLVDSQVPTYPWTSSAYLDTNMNGILDLGVDQQIMAGTTTFMVQPNGTQTIFVRVNAPLSAGSPPDLTTLTATYNVGASSVAVTDTTSLTNGLKLDKYQQLVPACNPAPTTTLTAGVPNAPWSNMAFAASANTVPGKCIAYVVVGTNTTASNITNINVTDVVPANTSLEAGCGLPAVTGPVAVTGGPYATGFTGTVSAASSPLATTPLPPTGIFTLQFCVKIN